MKTYANIASLLAALLLVILVMATTTATLIIVTLTIVATITIVVTAREKRKEREAAFWAQAQAVAKEEFEKEEINNYLLEEMKDQIVSEILSSLDEKEETENDFDGISGKGGKKKYIPLMSTPEGDQLWWVNYSRGRDGWSRGGHSSGKRGYHDPRYKDHRNQEVRSLKRLDTSWYEEEVKVF